MNRYEGMFLVDNTTVNNDWDNLVGHIQGILTKHNSENIETQKWGERKLAYKIGEHVHGTYILVRFDAPNIAVSAMRKEFELSDKIIRLLILRDDGNLSMISTPPFDEEGKNENEAPVTDAKAEEGSEVAENAAPVSEPDSGDKPDEGVEAEAESKEEEVTA